MAEDTVSQAVDTGTNQSAPEMPAGHEKSGAKGILREAIQKVMEEIEHHEREARHHLEQAAELRKALRESISFLHEEGEKKTPIAIRRGGRSDKTDRPGSDANDKLSGTSNKSRRSKAK
jgi:hypothetical protein